MSSKSTFSWELYHKTPVIGIIRGMPLDIVIQIAKVYTEAGFHTLEVTMNTPHAAEMITALRGEFPELNVGAGTVCNTDDLSAALAAGAQFIVTPIIDEAVIKASVAQSMPIFPGAYSPTEIYRAWSLGASAIKVFPASQLGAQYIKEVLAPLNEVKLLPTGGVSLENIRSFFEAGAVGVGMGGSLFKKELVEKRDFEALLTHLVSIKEKLKTI